MYQRARQKVEDIPHHLAQMVQEISDADLLYVKVGKPEAGLRLRPGRSTKTGNIAPMSGFVDSPPMYTTNVVSREGNRLCVLSTAIELDAEFKDDADVPKIGLFNVSGWEVLTGD